MRNLLIILLAFILCGCGTLSNIINEKKYTFSIHETENVRHGFGYYEDGDYIGYGIRGQFGSKKKTDSTKSKNNQRKNP